MNQVPLSPPSAGATSDHLPSIHGELTYHLPQGESAVLRYSEEPEGFQIEIVLVPGRFRSSGIGTLLVSRLLILADALGKPVTTTARPLGQRSPEILARLVSYYERMGFVAEKPGINAMHMRRPPTPANAEPLPRP